MRIHLCCGPQQYPGWLNFDAIDFGFNVVADLGKTWTFAPADSADYIVCRDDFEHMESPAHFLTEAARILIPGGCLELWVPHYKIHRPTASHIGPIIRGACSLCFLSCTMRCRT
jgi:predicted SAM-dependent methyltransferase